MYQSFIQLYNAEKVKPTPCEAFIKEVAALTHRKESTVRKWAIGVAEPDENTKHQLAEHFNIPVNVLFPGIKSRSHEKQPA